MNDTRKLLPCPFCGGEAYFRKTSNGYQGGNRSFEFNIECRECRASMPKTYKLTYALMEDGELEFSTDERGQAISVWNRRA